MMCEYDDGNGWCTGKYKGFGCIKNKCSVLKASDEFDDGCPGIAGEGMYCSKFNRFFCAGEENCTDTASYNRKLEMGSL